MEIIILASLLSCNQASWLASGAVRSTAMSQSEKIDVIKEIKRATEPGCDLSVYSPIDDLGQDWLNESTR